MNNKENLLKAFNEAVQREFKIHENVDDSHLWNIANALNFNLYKLDEFTEFAKMACKVVLNTLRGNTYQKDRKDNIHNRGYFDDDFALSEFYENYAASINEYFFDTYGRDFDYIENTKNYDRENSLTGIQLAATEFYIEAVLSDLVAELGIDLKYLKDAHII